MNPVIFHVDMDAFFSSVEQLDNPSLAGKPVIVGGRVEERGVVSACSYEARAFGVHSAMPMFQAKKLCPMGIFVPGRMKRYQEVSREVMAIFREFAPSVQPISIDEAFLDMTGTGRIYGTPQEAALVLKQRVEGEIGLKMSVGIGTSKYIAKLASDFRKPDGLWEVPPGGETDFIDQFTVRSLWGIGDKTAERLRLLGLTEPKQVRSLSRESLMRTIGRSLGSFLHDVCRGIDPGIFALRESSQSISCEETFSRDISDPWEVSCRLLSLAHQVIFRSLDEQVLGRTVFVKYKLTDFRSFTAQTSRETPFMSAEEIHSQARELLRSRWNGDPPLRLVGVGISSLSPAGEQVQGELFEDPYGKKRAVEEAVHRLKRRGSSLAKATSLLERYDKRRK